MICDNCKSEFQPRSQGRAQKFCPGGKCRAEFNIKARCAGAQVLRKGGGKRPRGERLDLVARMEREAEAAGTPGMFPAPGSRPALDLRLELGRAALRMGLL